MTDLDTFELLPPPKPGLRDMLIERICPEEAPPSPGVDIDRVHSSKPWAQAKIDALTVAEARELWGILNKMFGSQP